MAWLATRYVNSVLELKCLKNRFAEEGYFKFQLQAGGFVEVVGDAQTGNIKTFQQAVKQ